MFLECPRMGDDQLMYYVYLIWSSELLLAYSLYHFHQRMNSTDSAINITTKNFPISNLILFLSLQQFTFYASLLYLGNEHMLFNLCRKGLCHFEVSDSLKRECDKYTLNMGKMDCRSWDKWWVWTETLRGTPNHWHGSN